VERAVSAETLALVRLSVEDLGPIGSLRRLEELMSESLPNATDCLAFSGLRATFVDYTVGHCTASGCGSFEVTSQERSVGSDRPCPEGVEVLAALREERARDCRRRLNTGPPAPVEN
jgi:hypothetical protein